VPWMDREEEGKGGGETEEGGGRGAPGEGEVGRGRRAGGAAAAFPAFSRGELVVVRRSSGRMALGMIELPAPLQRYSTAPPRRGSDGEGSARLEYIVRVESPYPYRRAAKVGERGAEAAGKSAPPASSSTDLLSFRLLAEDAIGKISSVDRRAETGAGVFFWRRRCLVALRGRLRGFLFPPPSSSPPPF